MLWIKVLSVAIPLAVVVLLNLPTKLELGDWVYLLPDAIGVINTLTSIALIAAIIVKNKKIDLHKKFNSLAFVLGALFLVCYVIYHASVNYSFRRRRRADISISFIDITHCPIDRCGTDGFIIILLCFKWND